MDLKNSKTGRKRKINEYTNALELKLFFENWLYLINYKMETTFLQKKIPENILLTSMAQPCIFKISKTVYERVNCYFKRKHTSSLFPLS